MHKSFKHKPFRPTSHFEPMEPRRLFSATGGGLSILNGIDVNEGMYVPGHQLRATVSVITSQGLDGLPVKLALSKDNTVGNKDDIVLGTSPVKTTSWPGVVYSTSTAGFDVTLPASLQDGTYRVVAQSADGSKVLGPSITVTTPQPGTDLEINYGMMFQYLWPESNGSPVASVRNDGTVNSGPWTMALYLSKDKVLGNGDDILVYSGPPTNGGAGIGDADTVNAWLAFNRSSVNIPDGVYYPIFVVDPDNQIAETNETNNVWVAAPITAGPHPSQVGARSIATAARTDPGSTLSVDVTTTPLEGMPQRDLYFELLAPDGTIYRLGGTLSLPTADGHVDLSVPADIPAGEYQLRTMVDIDGMTCMVEVADRDPATVGPTVWVGMDPPADPTPAAPPATTTEPPTVTPLEVVAGSTGRLPLVVSNAKNRNVRRDYNVSFYLSNDPTLSRDDRKFSRTRVTANVAAAQSNAILASYHLPKAARLGTQYLIAVADPVSNATADSSAKSLRSKGAPAGRVRLVVPVSVVGSQLTAAVRSAQPIDGRPDTQRVTVRVTNTSPTPFAGAATLRLLTDSDSPETLLTTQRTLHLKPGQHRDLTLTTSTNTPPSNLRATIS